MTAIRDLSFDVEEGRFFVLFGPSSVGKTTTLRTIAGLVQPDAGRLEIGGQDMTHAPIAGRGVSMVFQSFALYPHLTVYENLAYPLREEKAARGEIDRRVKETAEMLKLSHRLRAQAQHAVGRRAAARRPRPLADPPAEDPAARRAADQPRRQAAPRHARRAEAPAPSVRHDHRLCHARRTRGPVDGRGNRRDARWRASSRCGTPDELYERPIDTYVAGKIGSPHMNMFKALGARRRQVFRHAARQSGSGDGAQDAPMPARPR